MSGAAARTYELLRQRAKSTGADVQSLAVSYAIERFMARLMANDSAGAITVKGGQSLGILFGNQMRPTKDLDINVGADAAENPEEWAASAIAAACEGGWDDGLSIDAAGLSFERRGHQGDGGLRITVPCSVHTCRTTFVIDVGIGNEITFEPSLVKVPGVLGGHKAAPPALDARVYPHENTLAEKIAAKVEDGTASIRHKDFFDVWLCIEIMRRAGDLRLLVARDDEMTPAEADLVREVKARLADGTLLSMPRREIEPECLDRLGLALSRTAAHRGTTIPEDLEGWLREEFAADAHHSAQWANWCRNQKGRLLFQPPGTGKDDDRAAALSVLLDDIGPVVGEMASRAHALAIPSP